MQYFFKPLVVLFTLVLLIAYPVHGDDVPATPSGEVKCTPSCAQSPPPPSPPPPSPPPPSPCPPPPALPPPPPPKKPPSTPYCPPPPYGPSGPSGPSGLFYITGPPGELYPVDQNFNGASRSFGRAVLPVFLGLVALLLAFY